MSSSRFWIVFIRWKKRPLFFCKPLLLVEIPEKLTHLSHFLPVPLSTSPRFIPWLLCSFESNPLDSLFGFFRCLHSLQSNSSRYSNRSFYFLYCTLPPPQVFKVAFQVASILLGDGSFAWTNWLFANIYMSIWIGWCVPTWTIVLNQSSITSHCKMKSKQELSPFHLNQCSLELNLDIFWKMWYAPYPVTTIVVASDSTLNWKHCV